MKKIIALLLTLLLTLSMAACAGRQEEAKQEEPVELVVFAAASMTETLTEIAELYQKTAPEVRLVFTFDSSGTLKTQIEAGADCDVFISAAQKQMNQLDAACNGGDPDLVLQGTRVELVENQVALVVPEGNPAGVTSFADVSEERVGLIALGNSDVPVGQYSAGLFTNLGIWNALQSKITFGSNVKEVTTWVSEGVVDCGVVYSTDARSAGLEIVDVAPQVLLNERVIYPAAVLKNTRYEQAARAFLEFLQSEECAAVFQNAGFVIPE